MPTSPIRAYIASLGSNHIAILATEIGPAVGVLLLKDKVRTITKSESSEVC